MIIRKSLAFAAVALIAIATAANADPAFKRLLPLLIDLPGWTGAKPDGVTMETGNSGAFTTASRKYTKDTASIEAAVITGPPAAGALGPVSAGMKFETTDGHMLPAEIGGYKAMESWNSKDKSGAIIGKLADDAAFVFNYRSLSRV